MKQLPEILMIPVALGMIIPRRIPSPAFTCITFHMLTNVSDVVSGDQWRVTDGTKANRPVGQRHGVTSLVPDRNFPSRIFKSGNPVYRRASRHVVGKIKRNSRTHDLRREELHARPSFPPIIIIIVVTTINTTT
jgi:hypothetical protein